MLGLPLLLAGLVLWFAGPWFEDQVIVGQIATGVGACVVVLQLIIVAAAASVTSRASKRFDRW